MDIERILKQKEATNDRGNKRHDIFHPSDRYIFDFGMCSNADGWAQYDTDQDASYFGVWVHLEKRMILTYCEGDVTLICCTSGDSFLHELDSMAKFYGPPPPAFISVSTDDGAVTHYFDERPRAPGSE